MGATDLEKYLFVLKLIGASNSDSRPYMLKQLGRLYSFLVVLVILFHICRFIGLMVEVNHSHLTTKLGVQIIFTVWLARCAYLYFHHIFEMSAKSLAATFVEFEKKEMANFSKSVRSKIKLVFYLSIVLSLIFVLAEEVLFVLQGVGFLPVDFTRNLYFYEPLFPYIFPCVMLFTSVVCSLSLCVYTRITMTVCYSFESLINRLRDISDVGSYSVEQFLKIATSEYCLLEDVVASLNKLFGTFTFILYLSNCPLIVMSLYLLAVSTEVNNSFKMQVSFSCMAFAFELFILSYYPSFIATRGSPLLFDLLRKRYNELQKDLHRQQTDSSEMGALQELHNFMMVLEMKPVQVKIAQRFRICPEFVVTMISAIVSYFVILVRFSGNAPKDAVGANPGFAAAE